MVYQYVFQLAENLMKSASQEPVKAAGVVATISVIAATFFIPTLFSGANLTGSDDLAPALTLEETKKIMTELFSLTAAHASQISIAVENIRGQMAQQGQSLSPDFMRKEILPHVAAGIEKAQNTVLAKFNADESDLEDAVKTYISEGDEEIFELALKIKKIYNKFGGDAIIDEDEDDDDTSEELSPNELVEVLKRLAVVLTEEANNFIDQYISTNGSIPVKDTNKLLAFQSSLGVATHQSQITLLKTLKVTDKQFENALVKHQNDPMVQKAYIAIEKQISEIYSKHGLAAEDAM